MTVIQGGPKKQAANFRPYRRQILIFKIYSVLDAFQSAL